MFKRFDKQLFAVQFSEIRQLDGFAVARQHAKFMISFCMTRINPKCLNKKFLSTKNVMVYFNAVFFT